VNGAIVLVLTVALLLTGCIPTAPVLTSPTVDPSPQSVARPQPTLSPLPSVIATNCGELWRQRVRRPERFTQVAPCATFSGVVRATKIEQDGDVHVQVLVEASAQHYLNARNTAAQHGALVVEIEPWEHGARTTAPDPTRVNAHAPAPYCPVFCTPAAGDQVLITSAIVTDNEAGHGWNEAYSPTDFRVTGHGASPHGDVPADPTDEDPAT
jgi:hypothetical protein